MKKTIDIKKSLILLATIGFGMAGLTACGTNSSLPEVEGKFGETPKISAGEKGKEPKKLQKAVLVAGKGEVCGANAILKTNYVGQLWDGKVFDSSFEHSGKTPGKNVPQPAVFPLSGVIKGWQEGLKDARPGSRIELVIPPDLGYGKQDSKQIPKNSTLVFVVDILDCFSSQNAKAGFEELKKAKPSNKTLPGIKIEGALGAQPKIIITDRAQLPKEKKIIDISEGAGTKIKLGDTVVFHIVSKSSQDNFPERGTWQQGKYKFAAQVAPPELVGKTAGSRVLIYFPGQGKKQPDGILVVDILGILSGSKK